MEDILIPLGFFAVVGYIAKLISDTRIRRKALEAHANADVADAILNRKWGEPSTKSALKWGLVVLALGAGILLVDLLSLGFESPVAYAILLLATGTALLGYYFIEAGNEDDLSLDQMTSSTASTGERTASESLHDLEE